MSEMRDGTTEEDKKYFVKNVLLENELPGDIPLKAREHNIPYAVTSSGLHHSRTSPV